MVDNARQRLFDFSKQELGEEMNFPPAFVEDYLAMQELIVELASGSARPTAPILGDGPPEGSVEADPGRFYVDMAAAAPIVTNGDFSQGTTGWTLNQGGSGSPTFEVINGQAVFNLNGSFDVGCYQDISGLVIGRQYIARATIIVNQGFNNGTRIILGDENNIGSGSFTETNTSTTLEWTFTPTSQSIRLIVRSANLNNTQGRFTVDGISIFDNSGFVTQSVYIKAIGTGNTGWVAT